MFAKEREAGRNDSILQNSHMLNMQVRCKRSSSRAHIATLMLRRTKLQRIGEVLARALHK